MKITPKVLVRLHLTMMVVWALLVIPTLLFWQDSIIVVLIYSIYANWVGHFGAFDAARAEVSTDEEK